MLGKSAVINILLFDGGGQGSNLCHMTDQSGDNFVHVALVRPHGIG